MSDSDDADHAASADHVADRVFRGAARALFIPIRRGPAGRTLNMTPYAPPRLGQALPSRGTLFTVRRNGETAERIIVPPANAVLTDVIGVGLATALFFSTDLLWVKIVAGVGGFWMLGALAGKAYTFARGSEGVAVIQPAARNI